MVTLERDAVVDAEFPAAAADGYELTSESDDSYNCIAWAADENQLNWWPMPFPMPGIYWPPDAPRVHSLEAFIQAYATIGYNDCGNNGALEVGVEKIALYATPDGKPQHAAKQTETGVWWSKLGPYKDIKHTSPAALESSELGETAYGRVVRYLKRARK